MSSLGSDVSVISLFDDNIACAPPNPRIIVLLNILYLLFSHKGITTLLACMIYMIYCERRSSPDETFFVSSGVIKPQFYMRNDFITPDGFVAWNLNWFICRHNCHCEERFVRRSNPENVHYLMIKLISGSPRLLRRLAMTFHATKPPRMKQKTFHPGYILYFTLCVDTSGLGASSYKNSML